MSLKRNEKIRALAELGSYLSSNQDYLTAIAHKAKMSNPWFTVDGILNSINSISNNYLDEDKLTSWASEYSHAQSPKSVGLILAGNIPLVGFHDILSVFIAGHKALIKCSSKDDFLVGEILRKLVQIAPSFSQYFEIVDKLSGMEAIIATGSDQAQSYFNHYFGKYPNIIRKNRNSLAVISGDENNDQLKDLGKDIFLYFGMGCRNVSMIFVPKNYNFSNLFDNWSEYKPIIYHDKYKNNFDYNLAIQMLNQSPYLTNEFVILVENDQLASRIASIHFKYYDQIEDVYNYINKHKEKIQCVVSKAQLESKTTNFGQTQSPSLVDYADDIDTVAYLNSL